MVVSGQTLIHEMLLAVKPGHCETGVTNRFLHEACHGLDPGVEMTEGVIVSLESRLG